MDDRAIPPRLLVALALVGAAGLVLLSEVVTMVTVSSSDAGLAAQVGVLDRIRLGTRLADLPVLALLPVAVLLARLVEPGAARSPLAATRAVLAGAAAVGSALVVLVVLRTLADVAGEDLLVDSRPPLATLLADLAALAVALAGAGWALRELGRTPRPESATSAPTATAPPPVARPVGGGFPTGPPSAPPEGRGPDWGRAPDRQ